MTLKQKVLAVFVGLLLILAITNPTKNDLLDYLGKPHSEAGSYGVKRNSNFLIFSFYEVLGKKNGYYENDRESSKYYFGILKNFFDL